MTMQSHSTQWKQRIGIVYLFVIALITGVGIWWFWFRTYVSTDDARVAATMQYVAPQAMSGRIEVITVEEGSPVVKGMILIELDHRTVEAQCAKARAQMEFKTQELKRAQELFAKHGMPRRELDRIRSEALIAEADLKCAEVALDNTYLRSSIDGRVVQKIAEVGNILEPGQTALVIADLAHAWVSAYIEETAVGPVKPGQSVRIVIDEGGELTGKVIEVRQAAAAQFALIPSDNAAGNFTKLVQRIPIKIGLNPHPEFLLRVGQSVEVTVRVRP